MKSTDIHGNYYDKYASKNPIEKFLMKNFFDTVCKLLSYTAGTEISSIVEAGCGEGHFTNFLRNAFPSATIDAFDNGPECISKADELYSDINVNFFKDSIYSPSCKPDSYSLACASEVFEHLENPEDALKSLENLSSDYILITVPNEPIWRIMNMCRFKYLKDFGNTPGHIQHWNRKTFLKMVATNSGLIPIKSLKSLPWLLFLFKKH